jgi:hypothetical protein
MRLTAAAAAVILALAAVASACDDDVESAQAVPLSCNGLRELTHYQYHLDMRLGPPEEPPDNPPSARDALGEAFNQKLLAYWVNGRVVQPDRAQAIFGYDGGQLEMRLVEGRFWIKTDDSFQEEGQPKGELPDAEDVCDFVAPVIAGARTETAPDSTYVYDSETRHYHVSLDGGEALQPLLGENAYGRYTIDLWLAKTGRWPTQLVIQSNNGEPDNERAYRLGMEVTDANDVSLRVDRP